MQPIFTIHAGEYLVGSYIESKFKKIKVWVPSKDTGVDLLLTDSKIKKLLPLQVKFSKDFLVAHMDDIFQKGLVSCGWWVLSRDKIRQSEACYWIFVLHTFNHKNIQFVIIKPSDLLNRLDKIHINQKSINIYFWVTKKRKCWETRRLKKQDQILIANHSYSNPVRDFSKFLNNWEQVIKELK